jgi:hypothetical protein
MQVKASVPCIASFGSSESSLTTVCLGNIWQALRRRTGEGHHQSHTSSHTYLSFILCHCANMCEQCSAPLFCGPESEQIGNAMLPWLWPWSVSSPFAPDGPVAWGGGGLSPLGCCVQVLDQLLIAMPLGFSVSGLRSCLPLFAGAPCQCVRCCVHVVLAANIYFR